MLQGGNSNIMEESVDDGENEFVFANNAGFFNIKNSVCTTACDREERTLQSNYEHEALMRDIYALNTMGENEVEELLFSPPSSPSPPPSSSFSTPPSSPSPRSIRQQSTNTIHTGVQPIHTEELNGCLLTETNLQPTEDPTTSPHPLFPPFPSPLPSTSYSIPTTPNATVDQQAVIEQFVAKCEELSNACDILRLGIYVWYVEFSTILCY